jgi:hypothetical protein
MSATAGFDVVFEIGPDALRDAIRANLQLDGARLNPPFELQTPFKNVPLIGSGVSYTIVTGLEVSLEGERGLRITLAFADSCIENDAASGFTVYGLAGTASIILQLALVQDGPLARTIGFDPAVAEVSVTFTDVSRTAIDASLQAAGLDVLGWQLVEGQAAQAMKDRLGRQSPRLQGFSFKVLPGVEGQLAPSLQFERLELRNLGTHAVGIFGSCRVADHDRGDPAQKTVLPLPPGQNVRMSVSAAAFHNLAFCPAISLKLGAPVPALPASCGGGGGVGFGPGSLVRMEDRFELGAIVVAGAVAKSGTCYEASMAFQIRFPMGLNPQGVVVAGTPEPMFGEADVDYDWYCELVAFAIGGPFLSGLMDVVRDSMKQAVESGVASALGPLLKGTTGGLTGAALPNTSFTSVEITAEALTLGGATRFSIPAPDPPYLSLRGGVDLLVAEGGVFALPNPQLLPRGIAHIDAFCVEGDFPITERLTRLEGTFWLETYRIPRPIHRALVLESFEGGPFSTPRLLSSASLPDGGVGTATLADTRSTYPFPVPEGIEVVQPVRVAYRIDRRFVRLYNTPSEGSYSLLLTFAVTNDSGLNERVNTGVTFVGNDALIGGSYAQELDDCIRSMIDKVNSYAKYTDVLPWEPVEHPRPDEIFARLKALHVSGDPELAAMSPLVGLGYNAAYLEAMLALPGVRTVVATTV